LSQCRRVLCGRGCLLRELGGAARE
jgi:hypothetical protein